MATLQCRELTVVAEYLFTTFQIPTRRNCHRGIIPVRNLQFLEAIVIGKRGYFGSGNGGGVHIVDLSDPTKPQLLGIVNSAKGNGHDSIHEMVIWDNFLIENFNGFSSKIIKVINISNPANPVFIRDINPTEINWVHAMHIRGNRMFTSGWGSSTNRGRTEIYDITNIASQAPTLIGFIEDPTSITAGNNMHSSWSSEDGNYLYSCRETNDGNGDVRVYDIQIRHSRCSSIELRCRVWESTPLRRIIRS